MPTPGFRPFFRPVAALVLAVALLAAASCSRQKNTVVSRNYHKLTGRDNYYFNGREKVKAGARQLAEAHVDRYDRLLTVFRYGDEAQAKSVYPDMDEAIKKASIVIQRHSMVFDGKEINPWVRESYLLIGKAQFYKHDFWAAIETFQFVASSYNSYPIRYEALLWLTQCYLQLGKTPDAEYLLDFMKNDRQFPVKAYQGFYSAIAADYHIQKGNYEQAIAELNTAIDNTKDKRQRIRYMFILGQLYQKLEMYQEAYVMYEGVSKRNSTYEMEFNARINSARCYDISTGSRQIKDRLLKMARDEKNKDYLDQIYYALASIAQRENDEPGAIELYRQSVAASTVNTGQKALSYLELAKIYFKRPDYRKAQVYYDSTVTFLSTDHPEYDALFNRKTSLTRLVRNLDIIEGQDSLLTLSSLTAAEREAAVDEIIRRENEEKRLEQQRRDSLKANEKQLEELPSAPTYIGGPGFQNFSPTGSGWYFYNPATVSFGMNEFAKRWGNRKLEDNWRLSSKSLALAGGPGEEGDGTEEDSTAALLAAQRDSIMKLDSKERKEAYLKAIPSGEEAMKKSKDRILEAYYNAGLIYKEQLEDYPATAGNFETMMQRFPENKYMLPVYYNLYRTYLAMGDTAKADVYKDILLNQHPDSEYAKLILNPNYYQENLKKTAILQVYYENTFRAYKNRQYYAVIDRKATADSLFPPNELTPKFAFLEALAIGKLRPLPEFEASLKKIVARYPKDSVSVRAQEILNQIGNLSFLPARDSVAAGESPAPEKPVETVGETTPRIAFRAQPDTAHYLVAMFPIGTVDANELKIRFSDFNQKFYSTANLLVTDALFQMEKQFVMVRSFRNGADAARYMKEVMDDDDVFFNIELSTMNLFTITPDNMILLMQSKDLDAYLAFYRDVYRKR